MHGWFTAAVTYITETFNTSLVEVVAALCISTVTALLLYIHERIEWRRAMFESRITISLNSVTKDTLRLRTLREVNVDDAILSHYARRLLKQAARKTTLDDPFLHFDTERDAWLVYNEVINDISALYADHIIATELGDNDPIEERFLVALTWERNSEKRIQKLRALLVKESTLRKIDGDFRNIKIEAPEHQSRIDTLLHMHDQFVNGIWPIYQTISMPQVYVEQNREV